MANTSWEQVPFLLVSGQAGILMDMVRGVSRGGAQGAQAPPWSSRSSMNIVCTYHNSVLVHQRNGLLCLYACTVVPKV